MGKGAKRKWMQMDGYKQFQKTKKQQQHVNLNTDSCQPRNAIFWTQVPLLLLSAWGQQGAASSGRKQWSVIYDVNH